MIPAPPGITAEYLIKRSDGKTGHMSRQVIAFNDDGDPLVAGRESLVHARCYGTYELFDHDTGCYTSLIPGGGWRVKWEDGDDDPILGWAVGLGGYIVALHSDASGAVEDSHEWPPDTYRIYHPDALPAETAESAQ